MSRMCVDLGHYELDQYWQSLGLSSVDQVRHEQLWRAAEQGEPPVHVEGCIACAELYQSFLQLRAVSVPAAGGEVVIATCPDASALAGYQGGDLEGPGAETIRAHLKTCAPCREDLAFLARSQEPRERLLSLRSRTILMAVAAAAFLAAVIPWNKGPATTRESPLDFKPSSKWVKLAQMPEVNRAEVLRDSPPEHHSRIEQVLVAYEQGEFAKAEEYAGVITAAVEDPGAEYLLAMARYKQNKLTEGYKAMLVSERLAPQTGTRCYATMQYALLMGDRKTVEREAHHAEAEPELAPRCRDILSLLG